MANLLDQLKEMTVVVADTGDIAAIEQFTPRDATTNPSLITAAAQMPQYQGIVDDTLKGARKTAGASADADRGDLKASADGLGQRCGYGLDNDGEGARVL